MTAKEIYTKYSEKALSWANQQLPEGETIKLVEPSGWVINAMKEYARQKCKEQRENCFLAWQHMPEWDSDTRKELIDRAEIAIKNAPRPELE